TTSESSRPTEPRDSGRFAWSRIEGGSFEETEETRPLPADWQGAGLLSSLTFRRRGPTGGRRPVYCSYLLGRRPSAGSRRPQPPLPGSPSRVRPRQADPALEG